MAPRLVSPRPWLCPSVPYLPVSFGEGMPCLLGILMFPSVESGQLARLPSGKQGSVLPEGQQPCRGASDRTSRVQSAAHSLSWSGAAGEGLQMERLSRSLSTGGGQCGKCAWVCWHEATLHPPGQTLVPGCICPRDNFSCSHKGGLVARQGSAAALCSLQLSGGEG